MARLRKGKTRLNMDIFHLETGSKKSEHCLNKSGRNYSLRPSDQTVCRW